MWWQFLLWGKQNKIPLPNTFIYNSVLEQKLSNSISTTLAAFFQLTSSTVWQLQSDAFNWTNIHLSYILIQKDQSRNKIWDIYSFSYLLAEVKASGDGSPELILLNLPINHPLQTVHMNVTSRLGREEARPLRTRLWSILWQSTHSSYEHRSVHLVPTNSSSGSSSSKNLPSSPFLSNAYL